jgi:hypothetical protein
LPYCLLIFYATATYFGAIAFRNDIPAGLGEHGIAKELYCECGYDVQAITDAVREITNDKVIMKQLKG